MRAFGAEIDSYTVQPKRPVDHIIHAPSAPSSSFHKQNVRIAGAVLVGTILGATVAVSSVGQTKPDNVSARSDNELTDKTSQVVQQVSTQPEIPLVAAPVAETVHNENAVSTQTNATSTKVTINGESIPVPESGSIHHETNNGNSRSVVDISIRSNSTARSSSKSSIVIE